MLQKILVLAESCTQLPVLVPRIFVFWSPTTLFNTEGPLRKKTPLMSTLTLVPTGMPVIGLGVGAGVGMGFGVGVAVGVDVGVGVGVGLGVKPPAAAFRASKSTPMSLPSVPAFR